jgi:hypothetical protein
VKAVIKIYEGIGGPDLLLNLFPRDDFTWILEQGLENKKGLVLKANSGASVAQLSRTKIQLKVVEMYELRQRD